jgi:hypothetical protein
MTDQWVPDPKLVRVRSFAALLALGAGTLLWLSTRVAISRVESGKATLGLILLWAAGDLLLLSVRRGRSPYWEGYNAFYHRISGFRFAWALLIVVLPSLLFFTLRMWTVF